MPETRQRSTKTMSHVSIDAIVEELESTDERHRELLDEESLTVEVGRYPGGSAAPKNPHNEDELYYVVSGNGKVRVGDETHSVEAGDLVYVEAGLEHDFFAIEETIVALIVFAAAEPTAYSIREEDDD